MSQNQLLDQLSSLAKITGITCSGIFAGKPYLILTIRTVPLTLQGYTWALTNATLPAILVAPDNVAIEQWRIQYIKAFRVRNLAVVDVSYVCISRTKRTRLMEP
jgi:hypothetical protein